MVVVPVMDLSGAARDAAQSDPMRLPIIAARERGNQAKSRADRSALVVLGRTTTNEVRVLQAVACQDALFPGANH